MKSRILRFASCVVIPPLLAAAGFGAPGTQASQTPSLGALARKLRAERACRKEKPITVFTNDNLPRSSSAPEKSAEAAASPQQEVKPKAAPSRQAKHDEKYFRSQVKKLEDQLSSDQRDLEALEQKLAAGGTEYHSNPQKTLEQESTPAFYSDRNKLLKQIEVKKQTIEQDQKAMDDLRDDLRRVGGDPGWLR